MRFLEIVNLFNEIESVSSGNRMRAILAKFFKKLSVKELKQACYLLLGDIDAEYKGIRLNLAEKSVLPAVAEAYGVSEKTLKEYRRKKGDLGEAAKSAAKKRASVLKLKEIIAKLKDIACLSGTESQKKKRETLVQLLRKSSPDEAKYVVRIVLHTLRLGAGKKTVLDGLSLAFTGSKDAKKEFERAYTISNDIGQVAEIAKKDIAGLGKMSILFGRPTSMMLAQRVNSIEEIPKKMGFPLMAEEKYDGVRVQAHRKGSRIILYSRRLEDITAQYPDIVSSLPNALSSRNYIVEGEIVAERKGKLLPFQFLMQRRRKKSIEKYAKKIPVSCYLFDLLYDGGKSYLMEPYGKRRLKLEAITKPANSIKLARQKRCTRLKQVEDFFKASLKRGCEGIICKSLRKSSYYHSGARAWQWIKWKKEYAKGLRDTFDVVIIGMYYGKGKRKGMFGSVVCAVYNKKSNKFESTTKVGTGFTETLNASLTKKLLGIKVSKKPDNVSAGKSLTPDVWVAPEIVIEIEGAEITKSPIHACGYAIRFPRFLRVRDDKSPYQVTTVEELK